MAQEQLSFPFQGGKEVMIAFFKDSVTVSAELMQKKVTGTAMFKFTANDKGDISKIIIYYADDILMAGPIIDALKKSNHKWIIPDREKTHDFIIPFLFSFNQPAAGTKGLQKAIYDNYRNRAPIFATDQVPLNESTLLPAVKISYDITE
jgi:hypothetical protein